MLSHKKMCEKSFSQAQKDSSIVMHAKKNFGPDILAKIKANNGFWACISQGSGKSKQHWNKSWRLDHKC